MKSKKRRRLTIEDMQELAKKRGGKCLSKKYINARTKLKWQCKMSHIWNATPDNIKRGTWCSVCAGVKKLNITDMQKIAEGKGGKCLSTEYTNNRTKLHWLCKKGHDWWATPGHVKRGEWCPRCAGKNKTIEDMQEWASKRGGACLSKEYVNINTKLQWQCAKGHIWWATPASVRFNWCPRCAHLLRGASQRLCIEDMQKLARERGGACLSSNYVNARKALEWKCGEGHVWSATPASVKNHWCRYCVKGGGISEKICKRYFEKIFGEKFLKKRPNWLVNEKRNRLELDGYCEKLGLAFEYQGQQHFEKLPFFHKEEGSLSTRISADLLKKKLCKRNSVTLIAIPFYIQIEDMKKYILKKCKEHGIKIPNNSEKISHELFNIYSPILLKEMRELAKKHGGWCLSTKYINAHTKLKWKCKRGHISERTPNKVRTGGWCLQCAILDRVSSLKWSIEEMHKIAKERGGKCLSTKYVNCHAKLNWRCAKGHTWWATPANVKNKKSWCPRCVGRKKPSNK